MKTKTDKSDFGKHVLFEVWECHEGGEKKGEYPIVKMGKKKLQAIVDNIEAAEKFLKEN